MIDTSADAAAAVVDFLVYTCATVIEVCVCVFGSLALCSSAICNKIK